MSWFARWRRRADAHARATEDALRASLAERARHAPAGDDLAERIIAAVDEPMPRRHASSRPRRSFSLGAWALPVAAAACVAGIAAIVIGVTGNDPTPPANHADKSYGILPTTARSVATPATRPASASESPVLSSPVSTGSTSSVSAAGTPRLVGVKIIDLTFADGEDNGWALASAHCVGGPGRCTALLRTHDGQKWTSMSGAAFNVPGVKGCARPCVQNIRFATNQIGYAFGPKALFMTTDGGFTWVNQHVGGAIALETYDRNVIRVTSSGTGCPSYCNVGVQTAAIGGSAWTTSTLPAPVGGYGVELVRGGSDAYLLSLGNPVGGGNNETSTLFRSNDDGATWTAGGEPCPQTGGEVDSRAVAAGGNGRVAALCVQRFSASRAFAASSTDGGANFAGQPGTIPANAAGGLLTGDPATVLVAASDGLARSTDGGATWKTVRQPVGPISFVGFESTTVGRAVADHGRAIWTTRNGGRTWTEVLFN